MIQMRVTFDDAIRLVVNAFTGKNRAAVLGYFADEDHVGAGKALDAMVVRGEIQLSRDGFYTRST
jgi:hypothetical protein